MPVLKELLASLGYQMVEKEGYEADDILGTLSAVTAERGDDALLATGDKDTLQLVRPGVTVLLTTTRFGKGETERMDEAAVHKEFGLTPHELIEMKALMGDSADNIPGVKGVGIKTATTLIQNFGTVENVYNNLDSDKITPAVKKRLEEGREDAVMSHKLSVIQCDIPIDTDLDDYKKQPTDEAAAFTILSDLEMTSIIKRLGLHGQLGVAGEEAPRKLPEAAIKPLETVPQGVVYMAPGDDESWLLVPHDEATVYTVAADASLLRDVVRSNTCEKWVFNGKALHHVALADSAEKPAQNIIFDGDVAAYLLDPNASGYGVNTLAAEYHITSLFTDDEDSAAGLLQPLLTTLHEKCDEAEMLPLLQDIELPLTEVLASMELAGVALDADGVRAFGENLEKQIKDQLDYIYQEVGYEFNVNSPKQLSKALFEDLGLPPQRRTKSGWSTDAETLDALRLKSPVIDTILQYRTYQKLNSTYVEGLLKEVKDDGRIHSTFNQTETRTGRISSNEPNMQNIPVRTELGSQMRAFFTARQDWFLADADYSQIELRILADISGDEALQQAFIDGEDIHRATAARVHGMPPEMITPALRSSAKAVNFGIVYGIGAFSLSKDIGVSVKEADKFIQNYFKSYPKVREYMDDAVAYGKEHGYVKTKYGRRRPVPELASSNRNIQNQGERISMNTPIQGTAADIIKIAMIRVYGRLRDEKLEARLILQVHDELIIETPPHEKEEVEAILKEEMEAAATLAVPLVVDVHSGKTWLDTKE